MRRRNVKHADERLDKCGDLMINNPEELKGNWDSAFPLNQKIYLEIGMGKGKFILENAKRNPHINYLGLEKYNSVIVQAAEKIAPLDLPNIHLINKDANKLLEYFGEKELDAIYLNFSDPWPKARHAKRRLTSKYFLDIYKKILKDTGFIAFKTDNFPLYEYSVESFKDNGYAIIEQSFDLHTEYTDIVTTEYEDRFLQKGNPIYYLKAIKE